jgi:hypothetical protein
MKDLKKAIQRCYPTRLVENWFRDFSAQRRYDSNYYRSENELKLIMAFRVLQEDGVSCRSLKCADLEHLANIIRSQPQAIETETRTPNEK